MTAATKTDAALPDRFRDVDHLEEVMTAPSAALVAAMAKIPGDLVILGVGGKIGPTLARLARRAAPDKRVVGVAQFSEPGLRDKLTGWGVECVEADLLDRAQVEKLPKLPNVVFMAGRKFGSAGAEDLTWAMNAHVPALVAEAYAGSRIVAYSSGCVYPYVDVAKGGATEATPAVPPPGIYAYSCVAREAMFIHFSRKLGTPGRIIRLNYAIDMRYGVLFDIAARVHAGDPLDLTMGHVNVIWQGDANEFVLRALNHCTVPSSPLNVSGPPTSVRSLAEQFGQRFGKKPVFKGTEAPDAWLINTSESVRLFGEPRVSMARMIDWTADWVARGMPSLGKDTHFDTRDGAYEPTIEGVLAAAELPDADALVREAGWNQVAADWEIFRALGTVHTARMDKRVVATAATLPYGKFAWISMVLVAGEQRRHGLGTRLLKRCIAALSEQGRVPVLDATPAGLPLYRALGFQETWGYRRLARPNAVSMRDDARPAGGMIVRPTADADWPALCALDAAAFGADRSALLARLRGRLPAAELVAERHGRVAGFLVGRNGRSASQIGPLIAEDDDVAQALLARALPAIDGPVYVDFADSKTRILAWLADCGFTAQRPLTRMVLGRGSGFDDEARTFAVAGPELG